MSPRIAVLFHSRGGTVRALAASAAAGAREAGAEVRLLRVPDDRGAGREWPERPAVPQDVVWADGLVLACPTYYGNVSAPFKRFLESTSPLWRQGLLADRVATGITASTQRHGGRQATLAALHHTLYHWGCWVTGCDPATRAAGGTPYGLAADNRHGEPAPHERGAARALGRRLAALASRARRRPSAVPDGAAAEDAPATRLAVVHHGDDPAVRVLALEAAAAARALGARVRLRRVDGAVGRGDGRGARGDGWLGSWAAPAAAQDVEWADAVLFGAPVRLGAPAAPLLDFVQSLEPPEGGRTTLWGKPVSGFVSVPAPHAGAETALLDLGHVLLHAGAVLVPPGYTDPAIEAAGGNPYGACHSRTTGDLPTPQVLAAVAHQARRTLLAGGLLRPAPRPPDGPHPAAVSAAPRDGGRPEAVRGPHEPVRLGTPTTPTGGRSTA